MIKKKKVCSTFCKNKESLYMHIYVVYIVLNKAWREMLKYTHNLVKWLGRNNKGIREMNSFFRSMSLDFFHLLQWTSMML